MEIPWGARGAPARHLCTRLHRPRATPNGAQNVASTKTTPDTRITTSTTSQFDADVCSMLVDKMTKWVLSFDGTSDPLSFVEHMEERADTYRIDRKYLSHAIVVLLTGRAESWSRTSGLQGGAWAEVPREFLDFFLPPRYYQRLDDEIVSKGERTIQGILRRSSPSDAPRRILTRTRVGACV